MFNLTKLEVNELAEKANFNRNTTEKVLRLFSILQFINSKELGQYLILKGGTAINLFLLDLPRLSVDIDLDFALSLDKEETSKKRKYIDKTIKNYMIDEGYQLSDNSKFSHSLDSYVFSYNSSSNNKDVLKIEINYSNRIHVLDSVISESTKRLSNSVSVIRLSNEELIGSKINALMVRTTPRDIYDVYNLFKNNYIKNTNLIRKIALFYICLGSDVFIDFEEIKQKAFNKISELNYHKIKSSLIPVLHKGIIIDIKEICKYVVNELNILFILDDNDIKFIDDFNKRIFNPNILFEGYHTNSLINHPMGIWKTK